MVSITAGQKRPRIEKQTDPTREMNGLNSGMIIAMMTEKLVSNQLIDIF